jgi:hypothetical protein
MNASRAIPLAKAACIRLESAKLGIECSTTTDEADGLLVDAAALSASVDALVADATGTDGELTDLRHWQRRCGSYLMLAREAGAQSWSQITKRGIR